MSYLGSKGLPTSEMQPVIRRDLVRSIFVGEAGSRMTSARQDLQLKESV